MTCMPCGRMKVPQLISIRPMECWLATLNASSAIMSHALEQINAARIGVICKSASSAPHFLLARLQGYSFQSVFQLVFPAYTVQLHSISVLLTAFKTFCSNKLGIPTGTKLHFFNISSDMYAPWAHESTSLDINKAKGMLTSNAKRIFCNNVTCFGTNTCCWDRSHLQECFNYPSLLACKAPRVQLSICFPISLPAYTLQLPSISVLPTAFKTFCSNKLGIPTGTNLHFFNISSDISALWAHESTSIDVNKTNRMLTSNAKRIFCDNVCFGTKNCCSNRSHLQECFKCSSLLACKASRVQLSICFSISLSRIHLTASLYLCHADCFQDILFEQAGNSHWNKLAFLQHIK